MVKRRQSNAAASLAKTKSINATHAAINSVNSKNTQSVDESNKSTIAMVDRSADAKSSRPSASRALADVRKRVQQASTNLADIGAKFVIAHVERKSSENGHDRLRIVFRRAKGEDQIFDLTALIKLPNLLEPFLDGLKDYLTKISPRSRNAQVYGFMKGIVAYLLFAKPDATLADLDDQLLSAYVDWQNSVEASVKKEIALGANTARTAIGAFCRVVRAAAKQPRWSREASKLLNSLPRNSVRDHREATNPREILPFKDLLAIHQAALSEI